MKINNATLKAVAAAGLTVVLITGCETPTIPVTMNVAGEVKLNGVSKIALADFNSLKGDAFTGVMAADRRQAEQALRRSDLRSPVVAGHARD